MSNELKIGNGIPSSLTEAIQIGKVFYESGLFTDLKSAAQAIVKIQAGAELGIPAFASLSGIHIIQGRPTISAGLIASKIKSSGKYDYKIREMSDSLCVIDFYFGKELTGTSSFNLKDAQKAGTKNLEKFPRNMLFARAISNGARWYCPDVFHTTVYTPEEMEGVTEDAPAANYSVEEPAKPIEAPKPIVIESSAEIDAKRTALLEKLEGCKTGEEVNKLGMDNKDDVASLGIRDQFVKKSIALKKSINQTPANV